MKITINHDNCKHSSAYTERCIAATLRNPLSHKRYCMSQMEDDGIPDITVVMIEQGAQREIALHNRTEAELALIEDWMAV
jgi:hypothetical protein